MISALSQLKMKYQNFTTKWYMDIFFIMNSLPTYIKHTIWKWPIIFFERYYGWIFCLVFKFWYADVSSKIWISYAFKLVLVIWKLFCTGNDKTDKLINNKGKVLMKTFSDIYQTTQIHFWRNFIHIHGRRGNLTPPSKKKKKRKRFYVPLFDLKAFFRTVTSVILCVTCKIYHTYKVIGSINLLSPYKLVT